jgi:hypothetical protein
VVTATNLCPANHALRGDAGGWCNPPRAHFDLAQPAFLKIAAYRAGIVPVRYRRVSCGKKAGGVRFTVNGHARFTVSNVGGSGEIAAVFVRSGGSGAGGSGGSGWIAMRRNWGQNWECGALLAGRPLSFRVLAADGRALTCLNVAAAAWTFGRTYQCNLQF